MRALFVSVVLIAGALAGCGDRPQQALVLVSDEPPGARCADGGKVIATGLDRNGNGQLDPGEVTATRVLCNVGMPLVTRTVAEPAGKNCPNGGSAIESGPDRNGNGVLDDDEVATTTYACLGAPPPVLLTRVVAEPAGANCAKGGSAVQAGADVNGDGTLQDAEVQKTAYVCNRDVTELVRLDAEPAGSNCANGGTAVHVGPDLNGDGTLEDTEITRTSYICPPPPPVLVHRGDYYIKTQADVDALAGVQRIAGSLIVDSATVDQIELPDLQVIDDYLWLKSNPNLIGFSAYFLAASLRQIQITDNPKLTDLNIGNDFFFADLEISGDVTIARNGELEDLFGIGGLETVAGNLVIDDNDALSYLPGLDNVDGLTRVGGNLQITNNGSLRSWGLGALARVDGSLIVQNNPQLDGIYSLFDPLRLGEVDHDVVITDNAVLYTASGLPLQRVGGSITLARNPRLNDTRLLSGLSVLPGSLEISSSPALYWLDGMPLTTIGGDLRILDNAQLQEVSDGFNTSSLLAYVGGTLDIERNPQLWTLSSLTALAQVGKLTVLGNGGMFGIDLSRLAVAGTLDIERNAELGRLGLAALHQIGSGSIIDNASLPQCLVDALASAASPTNLTSSGNAGVCPSH